MNKKIMLVALAIALVAIATIGGTLAWLTSTPSAVNNTFTVGKVNIILDETKVDVDGKAVVPAERTTTNEYHLVPGGKYLKDPTVHVKAGSDACYVFVYVNDTLTPALETKVTTGVTLDSAIWTKYGTTDYYYTEVEAIAESAEDKDIAVFNTTIVIDGPSVTAEDIAAAANTDITVYAAAIQKANMTLDEAAAEAKTLIETKIGE